MRKKVGVGCTKLSSRGRLLSSAEAAQAMCASLARTSLSCDLALRTSSPRESAAPSRVDRC
eukprot:4743106-Pleurochrysis_carterae.AAC.1